MSYYIFSLLRVWLAWRRLCVPQVEEMELFCLGLLLLYLGKPVLLLWGPFSKHEQGWWCQLLQIAGSSGHSVSTSLLGGLDWIPVDSQALSGFLGSPSWATWAHSEGPQAVPFLCPSPPEDAVAGVGMSLLAGYSTQIFRGFGGEEGQICTLPFMKLVSHNFIHACSRKCLWC